MRIANIAATAGLLFAMTCAASALPALPGQPGIHEGSTVLVADGCGQGRYRGPGGACHPFGRGPYPGGYYGPYERNWNGCGPGWYRGPGGACHRYGRGPYPNGYYGPYR